MGKRDEAETEEEHTDEEVESEEEVGTEGQEPESGSRIKQLSNEAAKYRKQRNGARSERDEALMELAFLKASGRRFQDNDAAWKLADKSTITVTKDGTVAGVEEAIEALAEANPFLLTGDDETDDDDPFNPTHRSSGRKFNGPRKPTSGLDRAALAAKFPALRRLG